MSRNCIINLLMAIMIGLSVLAGAGHGAGSVQASDQCLTGKRAQKADGTDSRFYTLTARVRLLAFWISRPAVGAARITWSEGDDGTRELELLIGSDPAKAPMRVNRWGYIGERVLGTRADLIGIMTESEEQSIRQAHTNLSVSNAKHSFKGIRSWIDNGTEYSSVSYMKLDNDFTYRDVDLLLPQIPKAGMHVRTLRLPEGAEPGFLFAVRSLVDESVLAYVKSHTLYDKQSAARHYVFSGTAYELRRKSIRLVKEIAFNNQTFRQLLEAQFEARNLTTGRKSEFSITYGIQDPIAGIPVRVVYRPRWWFEAEMLLDSDAAAPQAAQGKASSWKSGTN